MGEHAGREAGYARANAGTPAELIARVMPTDAARAVGRFRPDGLGGFRAATAPAAPVRATREAAVEDERAWLDA